MIVRAQRVVLPDETGPRSIHIRDGRIVDVAGYDEVARDGDRGEGESADAPVDHGVEDGVRRVGGAGVFGHGGCLQATQEPRQDKRLAGLKRFCYPWRRAPSLVSVAFSFPSSSPLPCATPSTRPDRMAGARAEACRDRKSTRLNSSHG